LVIEKYHEQAEQNPIKKNGTSTKYMMALSLWEIHEIKVTKNKKTGIKITTHTQNQNEY
jgi:hypothetical protein